MSSADDSSVDQTALEVSAECAQKIKEELDSGRLITEFQSLLRHSTNQTTNAAKDPDNETLNRYWNILPYDFNRVQLGVVSEHRLVFGGVQRCIFFAGRLHQRELDIDAVRRGGRRTAVHRDARTDTGDDS